MVNLTGPALIGTIGYALYYWLDLRLPARAIRQVPAERRPDYQAGADQGSLDRAA